MKKFYLIAFVALFATTATSAQKTQNPKGLYHLQRFIYQDGRTTTPGFSQYKYVADSVGLLVSYNAARTTTQWDRMHVEIREPYPLLNTGEKPQGADGHGIQIFNVDDHQFYFKWYNEKWPAMSNLNEFITEVYTRDGIEKDVAQAFNLLEGKTGTANKFCGWWVRVAVADNPDGTGKRMQVPTLWKAYSPELSMVVNVANNGIVLGCNPTNTIRYENDSTIYEIGHPCNIHWLNNDCHTLTFVQENGQPLTEIWVRGGLPRKWQSVFNSDIKTYRDGMESLRDAVVEATQKDNLQRADEYLVESLEKDVAIEALCEGTMAIAMYLLLKKQQYKDCVDFSQRQLQRIKDYADAGHDHTVPSKIHVHLTELCRAVATYRSGDTEGGKKLMEERLSIVESEIEHYKPVKGMEQYINLLYYCNFMMYCLGYDVFGTERTLLYLDALTLMASAVTAQNKPLLLNCRACCYLQNGDKDNARKLWQQIKDLDADFFKNQPDDNPIKKAFGE